MRSGIHNMGREKRLAYLWRVVSVGEQDAAVRIYSFGAVRDAIFEVSNDCLTC